LDRSEMDHTEPNHVPHRQFIMCTQKTEQMTTVK